MTLFFPRRHSYLVNDWQNKCFMGPTFVSIYLFIYVEFMSSYVVFIDLQIYKKRFLSGFYLIFFWWRKQMSLFQSARFNALLKEKQDTYSHLLKGLSVKYHWLGGVRILIHSPRTHNAELRKTFSLKTTNNLCCVMHILSCLYASWSTCHYIKIHSDLSALQIQYLCTQSKGCHVECLHIDLKTFSLGKRINNFTMQGGNRYY